MKRIGIFQAVDICDYNTTNYKKMDLYIDKGELGFRLICNNCQPICSGHFTKLSGLEYLGYMLVVGSIKVNGTIE
jgi:hypothetical protein